MEDLNKYISNYKQQLKKGDILIAYSALVKFVTGLRTTLSKNLSGLYSFAGIQNGYMDYTYFYYSNPFLKKRKLKLGLVLNHLEMRFEIWLLGNTKQIQKQYWEKLKSTKWSKNISEMPKYSILETTIVNNPDFNKLNLLAQRIENSAVRISDEIINHLKSIN